MDRREFLKVSGSCAAHLTLWGSVVSPGVRSLFAASPVGRVVASEPWGRIEQMGEGVWALVSTPLASGDDVMRTMCNGGIVAGRSGVLLIEGFASDEGARWMADQARRLTGRAPTHVVLTHYHGDHSAGLGAYRNAGNGPHYLTSTLTRDRLKRGDHVEPAVNDVLGGAQVVDAGSAPIDLGGRRVTVTPRAGHTSSDLTVTVEDPSVVFCGDLLWIGLFPNYVDAIPSVLSREVRAMLKPTARFVPGHGNLAGQEDLAHYVALLDLVEDAARRGHQAGTPPAETAKRFKPPVSLGEWVRFDEGYYEVALKAWEKELNR